MLAMNTHIAASAHGPARARGFTLVELMVTCAVAGILTAMAVPAFNNFVLTDRDVGQLNSLVASFNYARSEAVKRNLATGVTVCPSNDAATCSGGTNWQGGWIVSYTDPVTGQPTVLQTVPVLGGSTTIKSTGNQTGITFLSSGMVTPAATSTFTVCDVRGATYAHEMEVSLTGRIVASPTTGQTVNGANLACP
jgi:type IV fimbrial biogenesis protein FimT